MRARLPAADMTRKENWKRRTTVVRLAPGVSDHD